MPEPLQYTHSWKESFNLLHPELSDAFKKKEEAKKRLEERLNELNQIPKTERSKGAENLLFFLESELKLSSQYESQKKIHEITNLSETLPSGLFGIKGIDGKEYAFPNLDEIRSLITPEKLNILRQKKSQGFGKMLIVPFAKSFDALTENLKETILAHHQAGKLMSTDKDGNDFALDLDKSEPVWIYGGLKKSDISKKLIYYPKDFSDNHQGKTKEEVINSLALPGYQIIFVEDDPVIPQKGANQIVGNRKRLEAGHAPKTYLQILTNPEKDINKNPYIHEQGLTPESWITYFITHLKETNHVLDSCDDNGKACYLTGSYITADEVPDFYWKRYDQQARLFGNFPDDEHENHGSRSAVII